MISNYYRTINRFAIPLTVFEVAASNNDGEVVETYSSGIARMMPVNMTAALLKYQPEGAYTFNDCKFLMVGSGVYTQRTMILYNGNNYRVNEVFDRSFEGNFTEYLCKRVDDQV